MMLDVGGGNCHGTTNVLDLQPCPFEIFRPLLLGDHAHGAVLHNLRHKLVRVKQLPTNSDKQTACSSLPRIVRNIGDDRRSIAREGGVCYFGKLVDCYRFVQIIFHISFDIFHFAIFRTISYEASMIASRGPMRSVPPRGSGWVLRSLTSASQTHPLPKL